MLILVDGSYYVFRAFFALRGMSNSKGLPTNGLYAFTNMLLNVVRDDKPTHLAVAFDPPGPTFRSDMFPEYKAHRDETPEDLIPQFPYFRQLVTALGIQSLELSGFEADDVIATLAALAGDEPCTILTGDKDLYQLVTPTTTLLDSMRGKRVGLDEVRERFAVEPLLVPDVLGLSGDTSDNIPGVPGIGEKTGGKLVAEFGSLEGVLASIAKVSGEKRRESLAAHADTARLSRELATVRRDVPLNVSLEDLRVRVPDFSSFDALCAELEFRRFPTTARESFRWAASAGDAVATLAPAAASFESPRAATVADVASLRALVATHADAKRMSLDLVVDGDHPLDTRVVGVAVAWDAQTGHYIPVGHADMLAPQLDLAQVLEELRPALQDASVEKATRDAKRAARVLAHHGIALAGIAHDTTLTAYVDDPNSRDGSPAALAMRWLGVELPRIASTGRSTPAPATLAVDQVAPVVGATTAALRALADATPDHLDATSRGLLTTMELPLAQVLGRMEATGIRVDVDRLATLSRAAAERIESLSEAIFDHAGHSFLIQSPMQLGKVLFDELKLPTKRREGVQPSTDAETLEALLDRHPIVGLVLEYREVTKLASTYIDSLPKLVRAETGRIHTTFHQTVASTGRLSSADPNLQNIPIRTTEGRRIREAFIPEDGWRMFAADYSQIELRILAHISGDRVLIDAFRAGHDIHRRTAAEVLGVDAGQVTSEQRAQAKAINFGLIYGMGASRLSRETHSTRDDAADYMARYFDRIGGVQPALQRLIAQARDRGYAETLLGRRRPIPELRSGESRRVLALGERLAMNSPIQGTAADIIKLAMLEVERRLDAASLRTRMLLSVHDELVFECPPDELDAATALVRTAMEGAMVLEVPLAVDLKVGDSWAALK